MSTIRVILSPSSFHASARPASPVHCPVALFRQAWLWTPHCSQQSSARARMARRMAGQFFGYRDKSLTGMDRTLVYCFQSWSFLCKDQDQPATTGARNPLLIGGFFVVPTTVLCHLGTLTYLIEKSTLKQVKFRLGG